MARIKAVVVLLAIVAFGLLTLAGALVFIDRFGGTKDRVVIGSKAFTESIIVGEIVSQLLEQSGIEVERHFNLGATNISFEAIRSGAVDMYPEYTGTGLIAILHHEPVADQASGDTVLETVRKEFSERYDLVWLDPLGFNNTYALAMPEELANRLGITKVSDLLAHRNLRAGFASEFLARDDGWPGLSRKYGLRFEREPGSMEAGLMYQAAASGQVDVISAYSTDGRIETQHLRVLEDDKGFFPPYEPVIMVRREALLKRPSLESRLRALRGIISEDEMRRMNADVDFGSRSIADVASSFLAQHRNELATRTSVRDAGPLDAAGALP
ncbi:MAG TPA: glycine betaine ABC transporter substrate-binding protein [Labilithrix sp.]|nr:glycine betaine ABC transporter substrate-binding protein [Labilithrix sp.]